MRKKSRRAALAILSALVVSLLLPFFEAEAAPPDDDVLTPLDAREIRRDVRLSSREEPPDGTPLWLSIAGGLATTDAGYEGLGMLTLGGALDRLASPPSASRAKEAPRDTRGLGRAPKGASEEDEKPRGRPNARAAADKLSQGASKSSSSGSHDAKAKLPQPEEGDTSPEPSSPTDRAPSPARELPNLPPPVEPRIDGAFARGLVRAARVEARTAKTDERLDGLATRARVSALLPEVRLRVARVSNDTQTLSPVEYDPTRVTASGGTGLWLEGRATFRLDRLVFADEEIGIERIRTERDRMDRALTMEVLTELTAWQRGAARALDPTLPDEDRITGEITEMSAAAALDVLSGGWFSAHLPKEAR